MGVLYEMYVHITTHYFIGTNELNRLKGLRVSSMRKIITTIRSDIIKLWKESDGILTPIEDPTLMTTTLLPSIQPDDQYDIQEHIQKFPTYAIPLEQLDETAIEIHEEYYNNLKNYVENEIRPLFIKISKRESILEDRLELENLQQNPERLTARGPKAREDRKREEVMTVRVKSLEKLTNDIINLINAWEKQHKREFIYANTRYIDTIKAQEQEYADNKENLRNTRKRKESSGSNTNSIMPAPLKQMRKSSVSTTPSASTVETTPSNNNTVTHTPSSGILPLSIKNLNTHVDHQETLSHTKGRDIRVSTDTICTSATMVIERCSTCTISKIDLN